MNRYTHSTSTPADIRTQKQALRRHFKQIRNQLPAQKVLENSSRIAKQLFHSSFWKQSSTVMLYLSFQNEVDTRMIYQRGWQEGKTMLLPICAPSGGRMEMSILHSFEQLEANRYGIGELPETLQNIVSPSEIDLCIIPGIAFDTTGTRLGFGAGYYDRYLERVNPKARRIALAHCCQIAAEPLPADCHDLPMQDIITEEQWYRITP